jgi:hypothetical protein
VSLPFPIVMTVEVKKRALSRGSETFMKYFRDLFVESY